MMSMAHSRCPQTHVLQPAVQVQHGAADGQQGSQVLCFALPCLAGSDGLLMVSFSPAGALRRSWQALQVVLAPSDTPRAQAPSAGGGRHATMHHKYAACVQQKHLLPAGTLRRSWQAQYGSKMWQARSFGGRFDQDTLHGHQAAVRSLAMLPGSSLLATGVHLPPCHAVWL